MKKLFGVVFVIFIFTGCTHVIRSNEVIIIKANDETDSYYEIELDKMGRINKIIPFSNGMKNGTEIYFRESKEVGALINYQEGKREGFVYEFRPLLCPGFKGLASGGKFNGQSTWYHGNGTPERTGSRFNDLYEGEWLEYYENKQLRAKGTYIRNQKQDDWKYWNEDGTEQ